MEENLEVYPYLQALWTSCLTPPHTPYIDYVTVIQLLCLAKPNMIAEGTCLPFHGEGRRQGEVFF